MSDLKNEDEKAFCIEYAKTGRATCKKCKEKCNVGVLRIARNVTNYFSDSGSMKHWYHIDCLFESFKTQKATTKKIESVEDIDGWNNITENERDLILDKLLQSPNKETKKNKIQLLKPEPISPTKYSCESNINPDSNDNLFQTFRNICQDIAECSSYIAKSETLQRFLTYGTNKQKFEGDFKLWMKLLLPMTTKRIYNLQSKQLVKLFSRIFRTDQQDMQIDLEQGDVSETIRKFYENSKNIKPVDGNKLSLQEVDEFLDKLSKQSKEDEQIELFTEFCNKCNAEDLKMVIRLIKHDLKINAGPSNILDALGSQAYTTFQLSRDLEKVVEKFAPTIALNKISTIDKKESDQKQKGSGVQLMVPISPMLAEACKSVDKAIAKNPEGMFSEIKYDGERVQIHKKGTEFRFFSRNLKPVQDHKIARCKEFIPKAFPTGQDIILDSEIVVVNTETGQLLPFGTLGVHKREEFVNSEVCLFIFDCIYFNGEDLTKKTLKERKNILENNLEPIENHVQLSEYYVIKTKKELASMTAKVLKAGLEGLVLKDMKSLYMPGKRGWLKIKKDYLFEGQMADTADLVVLGAWFGTGKKGGMLSIFLMGSFDTKEKVWKTVTKVHSGLDDPTMESLQDQFKKLMKRSDIDHLPKWISCKRSLVPDFIAVNPAVMPVWEITGAEFTKSEAHTANGISIRFPRVTRMRDDKSAKEATNLENLELLFASSKEHINVDLLFQDMKNDDAEENMSIKTKLFDMNVKTEMNNSADDDELEKPKKRHSSKTEDIAETSEKPTKRKKTSTDSCSPTATKQKIFDNKIIFFEAKLSDEILEKFLENGGIETKNSQSADIVIHLNDRCSENTKKIRTKYKPTSRHLTHNWLLHCIKNKKFIKQFPEYAVKL